jgi:hypothetical protein
MLSTSISGTTSSKEAATVTYRKTRRVLAPITFRMYKFWTNNCRIEAKIVFWQTRKSQDYRKSKKEQGQVFRYDRQAILCLRIPVPPARFSSLQESMFRFLMLDQMFCKPKESKSYPPDMYLAHVQSQCCPVAANSMQLRTTQAREAGGVGSHGERRLVRF